MSGHTCAVDDLLGHFTQAGGKLWVLDTCGRDLPQGDRRTTDWQLDFGPKATGLPAKGTNMRWETDTIWVKGGQFRLCWCAATASCSILEDFY